MLPAPLTHYEPDRNDRNRNLATAMRLDAVQSAMETPFHQHRKGQLIMVLHGGITCELNDALLMVPPHCTEWIPGDYAPDSPTGRLVVVMLEQLANMPEENLSLPFSSYPRIRRVTDTLNQSPAERHTLSAWAKLFIKETGMTFSRWRQRLQLIIAIREPASGTRVQRVAENLGYDSPSAFITTFKKALGKPPG
ncbi:helix-turn-helix domain-containing protein [Sodalis sp. (in: enterobacteria)]|uniref:helix-turn-helix transcriptional regulator n=1 Tax=Sodalis sp. (in: enterobacteria) TaxID=1898979 RepID=UPI003F684EF2